MLFDWAHLMILICILYQTHLHDACTYFVENLVKWLFFCLLLHTRFGNEISVACWLIFDPRSSVVEQIWTSVNRNSILCGLWLNSFQHICKVLNKSSLFAEFLTGIRKSETMRNRNKMSLKHMHEAHFLSFPPWLMTKVTYQGDFMLWFITTGHSCKFKQYVFHTIKKW